MKKSLLFVSTFLIASLFCVNVSAKKVLITDIEKIAKIADLPHTEDYLSIDSVHFDLGYKYTVKGLFYVPLYLTGEPTVVGYLNSDNYVELTKEDIDYIATENKIDLKKVAAIPFWDKWGGKSIAVALLVAIVGYYFGFKKKEEEKVEA